MRIDDGLFAPAEIGQPLEAFLDERPEHHAAVEPQGIGGRQDEPVVAMSATQGVDLEHGDERQEYSPTKRTCRQADILPLVEDQGTRRHRPACC